MPDIYVAPQNKKTTAKEIKTARATGNPLAAFLFKPKNVRFETQDKQEKIVLLLRRHWFANFSWIITAILMVFAPLLLRFFPLLISLPGRYQTIAVIFWYLLTCAFILENFLSWYFNVDIVTDERIVDIDFYSLIYKEISHCKIDRIQDVTFKMGGIFKTIFNYGDVIIQTAGEIPVFEFESVPKPGLVAKRLNDLILEEEQEKIDGRVR